MTWALRIISIIAENKPHAHPKTHLHKTKVYNTRLVYSLTVEVFTEIFSCCKVIDVFMGWPIWKSSTSFTSILSKLCSRNKALRRDMILIPSFHGLCQECLGPWSPFGMHTPKKKWLNFLRFAAKASGTKTEFLPGILNILWCVLKLWIYDIWELWLVCSCVGLTVYITVSLEPCSGHFALFPFLSSAVSFYIARK